jgi:ATP-dependent DNA helicase RecG
VAGEVLSSGIRPTRRPGFRLFELVVKDETGPVRAVFPNQAFLRDVFQPGQLVVLYGSVEFRGSGGLQLTNPEYEVIRGDADEDDATVHTGRIVPIYEKAGSVTTRMQRTLVHRLLSEMPAEVADPVPDAIRQQRRLPSRRQALADTHFPPASARVEELNAFRSPAQQRLIFEEFLLFQGGTRPAKAATCGRPQAASRGR